MKETRTFFKYVIPSIFSFALSGVYAIVDGFFVGNSIGDIGISAINVAYPVSAVLQALGTGLGMGGAVYYAISKAEKNETLTRKFTAGAMWLLLITSVILTFATFFLNTPLLRLLGAEGELLSLGEEYIAIIALGAGLQIIGTGMVPFIRNHEGSFEAMLSMAAGFLTNIILDYLFVWILQQGVAGAAIATVIGQGVTFLTALIYMLRYKQFTLKIPFSDMAAVSKKIVKIGIAPFGLAMAPNISLIIINRFSIFYGGEKAVAVYSCIAYIISIVYLIFQGVGDGSQPIISKYYGERNFSRLRDIRKLAYGFGIMLSLASCIIMYLARRNIGTLFGVSAEVNIEVAKIIPIFLISVPFVAITRITTASFYATEESLFSYILTYIEPVFMLLFMFALPPAFGGQIMIWWSTVFARVLSAGLSLILKDHADRKNWQSNMDKKVYGQPLV